MKHPEKHNKTILCFAYDSDLEQIYAFYCSRYKDISFKEFLDLGLSEFFMKLNSIPENEPLYKIIQSRTIDIAKIKDKEEKKYWREQKRINKIPEIYLSNREIEEDLKESMKNVGGINE
ncbi:MAG: Gp15 family bacteriophage protein [Methanosphaera sp.]|nr:Gp15 family bacteriophage protein [Methanosphaera sp.]